jgi:glycosyltransferase involved in cell wall biosynthesis
MKMRGGLRCLRDLKEVVRPYYLRWVYFRLFPRAKPEHFSACWSYPWYPLSPCTPVSADEIRFHPSFLFLPMADWHSRIQRSQHLARALARRGHLCFYLNPHLGREYPRTRFTEKDHRVAKLGPLLLELHVRLPREPVFHHRLLRDAENRTVLAALATLLQGSAIQWVIQMVSLPTWCDVAVGLRRISGSPIVYDCHDFLSGFRAIGREIIEREIELFRLSDMVVFSAQQLMERKVAQFPWLREKAVLIRNAADFFHFTTGLQASSPARARARKVIGYAGSLNHWFDTEAVRQAALRHPEWQFILIGRIEDERILALRGVDNVHLLGEVPYAELPKYLAEFDVGLIPFLRNELTLATNPIKLYEYFSLGLPVVSTRLPEVQFYSDLVYIADDSHSFAVQVERAAREKDESLRNRRVAIARQETWESRAEQLLVACKRITPAV